MQVLVQLYFIWSEIQYLSLDILYSFWNSVSSFARMLWSLHCVCSHKINEWVLEIIFVCEYSQVQVSTVCLYLCYTYAAFYISKYFFDWLMLHYKSDTKLVFFHRMLTLENIMHVFPLRKIFISNNKNFILHLGSEFPLLGVCFIKLLI